jgi:hypothetical protein
MMAVEETTECAGSVEFFGVKLKVKNPRLAALLNSSIGDDVQVIGRRARDAFAGDSRAEYENLHRGPLRAHAHVAPARVEEED